MSEKLKLAYFGWSCFAIESDNGNLLFDPFFRPMHGASWANLDDFRNTKVICVTHGHYEHYLDTAPIVNLTGATVVSSQDICNHLTSSFEVQENKLVPIEPFQEVNVSGFRITAFEWRHRDISFWKFFKGNVITALQFVWYALVKSPFSAPKFGYYVEGPGNLQLMNYNEGFNNIMDIEEVRELGQRFKPKVLLAGMQLNFEEHLADGIALLSPETVVLFHPHEKLFEKLRLTSSPPEAFVECVKRKLPQEKVIIAKPVSSYTIP